MTNDRSERVVIAGAEYELILTTRATKEIAKKFGGLEALGEKIFDSRHFEQAIDDYIWLITLLANQGVDVYNIRHLDDRREHLTAEAVELLTTPMEIVELKSAVVAALIKGSRRVVVSAETGDEKNV